jgi:excisionase family DNA binding protein
MAQGYYSLEEAAQILGVSTDELKRMARRNEVRPFFDRGAMRFRSQEVDEKARSLGRSGGGDQPAAAPPAAASPPAPAPAGGAGEVFGFNLTPDDSDQVEIGQEILAGSSSSLGRKSNPKLASTESPPPAKKSDSKPSRDSGMIPLVSDSDVNVVDDPGAPGRSGPRKSGLASEPKSGVKKGPKSDPARKSGAASEARSDSGVRLVPMQGESDSDVKIVPDKGEDEAATIQMQAPSPEDSDIRLAPAPSSKPESGIKKRAPQTMMAPGAKETMQTEEIDLDAELRKAQQEPRSKSKLIPPAAPKSPQQSPFELSDADITLPEGEGAPPSGTRKKETATVLPADESEEVELGELSPGGVSAHDSGINLQKVSDSGISLEKPDADAESVEFELQPDESGAPSTSKSKKGKGKDKAKPPAQKPKAAAAGVEEVTEGEKEDSSEFELTLDDSGLAPLEEEKAAQPGEGEKDIFETDFEMPALEDESGFEPVPIEEGDTDLESSDFDLALGDEDIAAEEESGSQVVALEDEEADEGAATVARPPKKKAAEGEAVEEEEGIEDLLADEDIVAEEEAEAEEEEARAPVTVAVGRPQEWGAMPMLVMIPCVILMFFLGIMSFEVLHTMWGYHQPAKPVSPVVNTVTGWFLDVPKE